MKTIKPRQTRPFHAIIPNSYKNFLQTETAKDGIERGLFFSTSGKLCYEVVNPTAQYSYIFRTNHKG